MPDVVKVTNTRGGSANIDATPLLNGQILYDREAKRIFLDAIVDGELVRIVMKEGTFTGTELQWEALTDAQKAIFTFVNILDDYEFHSDVFVGATSETDGQVGLVTRPMAGDQGKVLYGDGTWKTPSSGVTTLAALTDVDLSSQTDGQALVWDNANSKWVNGDVAIDVDSTMSSTSENPVQNKVIYTALDDKVDKVTGKGLSTEDYTTAEQTKLGNIEAGAQVNVQADWAEDDTTSDAYIANKPSIPTATSDLTNDSDFVSDANYSHITVDSTLDSLSSNPVENQAIYSALSGKVDTSAVGVASGIAELDSNGVVPSSQLPSYVDDIIEGYYKEADGKFYEESTYETEITGEAGKIYLSLDTDTPYRWGGSAFVAIPWGLALGETSSTAYRGDRGKAAYDHASDSSKIASATSSGLYKVASTAEGHIASLTAVTKSDITDLGIPAQDTTYSDGTGITLSGTTFSLTSGVVTAGSAGPTAAVTGTEGTTIEVPKITVDTYGRVTGLTSYTLTNKDTTYSDATTSASGLMSASDKVKVNNTKATYYQSTQPSGVSTGDIWIA